MPTVARKVLDQLPRDIRYQIDVWRRPHRYHEENQIFAAYLAKKARLRCVFVHVPKAGGISVKMALFGRRGGAHRSAEDYKRVLGPIEYRRRYSFTFVRDPYTRLVSAYTFLRAGGIVPRDRRFADEHLAPFAEGPDGFRRFVLDWLTPDRTGLIWHLQPQVNFVCDGRTGGRPRVAVDFVGRFERLDRDFEHVARTLGVTGPDGEPLTLPHKNDTGRKRDPDEFYTPAVRARVAELYREDFETFRYPT